MDNTVIIMNNQGYNLIASKPSEHPPSREKQLFIWYVVYWYILWSSQKLFHMVLVCLYIIITYYSRKCINQVRLPILLVVSS